MSKIALHCPTGTIRRVLVSQIAGQNSPLPMSRGRSGQARAPSTASASDNTHVLKVPIPGNFDLGTAVSSYGFFMLAPNRWVKVRSFPAYKL